MRRRHAIYRRLSIVVLILLFGLTSSVAAASADLFQDADTVSAAEDIAADVDRLLEQNLPPAAAKGKDRPTQIPASLTDWRPNRLSPVSALRSLAAAPTIMGERSSSLSPRRRDHNNIDPLSQLPDFGQMNPINLTTNLHPIDRVDSEHGQIAPTQTQPFNKGLNDSGGSPPKSQFQPDSAEPLVEADQDRTPTTLPPQFATSSVTTTLYLPIVSGEGDETTPDETAIITPGSGGALTTSDGYLHLIAPPGAVSSPVTLHYRRLPNQTIPGYQTVDRFFELTAQDEQGNPVSQFEQALTLTVSYEQTASLAEDQISLYFKDGPIWRPISSTVYTETNQVVASTDHFTVFGLLVSGDWAIGNIVGLCKGTTIHHGPGLPYHTIVPEDDWLVLVTHGPRIDANGDLWWDTDRKALDQLPTSGTGWVNQSQEAEACLGNGVPIDPDDPNGGLGLPPLAELLRELLLQLGYSEGQIEQFLQGDPVNPATGNFVHQKTDLNIPGVAGLDFVLQRFYNSQDDRAGVFGLGWSSLLDMSIRLANDGSLDLRYPDGHGVHFVAEGDTYTPGQDGIFDTLTYSEAGFELTTPDQMTYIFDDKHQLQAVQDRHENTITFERNDDRQIIRIIDSAGREFNLTYDGDHIASVSDPAGRTIRYAYNGEGDLMSVTDGNGGVYRFEYQDHRMIALTDPEGIVYLQNRYDDQGRVIEQSDASGSVSIFTYNEGETLFVDNLGRLTRDNFDTLSRITEREDALGQTEQYVYDGFRVTGYTDKRGNTWQYTYDERGNLLTEADPLGQVTSSTYNETNDLTGLTDQGGPGGSARTTGFVYDDEGNLIRIERPDGTTITTTYDGQGQLLSLTDPNGHTTTYDYDGQGNLVKVTDPLGFETGYTCDAVGRLTAITDANGHTAQFEYDGNDNITRITDPKGRAISLTYDGINSLTELTDRRGGVTHYGYDENLKLMTETDPKGHTTTHAYDAMYNRIRTTDPRGNVTEFRYDELYRLVEIENALGAVTHLGYDPNGNITEVRDALNQITGFDYDELNRLTQVTDALGGLTGYIYDPVDRLTTETNPAGAVTQYEYDLLDRLTLVRDALNGEWRISYDDAGNPTLITDANGHAAAYAYDDADRLTGRTDPGGHTTRFDYDGVGNRTAVTDTLGRVTRYAYDENDNLTTITDALNGLTRLAYDEEDNLVSLTDANNHTTQLAYGLDGLLSQLTEPGGQVTTYDYDPTHNLTHLTNARGNTWTYAYDALNRRTGQTDPLGFVTAYAYDPLNRLSHITDANGMTTRYDYDALDRLVAVVQNEQPAGPADHQTNVATGYGYDPAGNLTTITDANGHVTTFSYDLLDRLLEEINPLGNGWQYEYDPVGNLVSRTDANGQVTRYDYDPDDLLTAISYPGGAGVTFAYDAVHNQTGMADSLGPTQNEYDALNRLVTSTNHLGQRVGYSYDPAGNRTGLTYPDGRAMTYAYDANDRQVQISDPDGNIFKVTYDPTHNITTIDYPNQTRARYSFDAADRLLSVVNEQFDGDRISSFAYDLDPAGNRLRSDDYYNWRQPGELSHTYTYDPLYRLTRSEDSEGRFNQYSYDAVGNRLSLSSNYDPLRTPTEVSPYSVASTYNAANQLLSAAHSVFGLTTYTYDANGNRVRRQGPDVWTGSGQDILRTDYSYDFENRLTWVGNFRDPGNGQWQVQDETAMQYDGYGRLFQRMHDMHQGAGGQKIVEYVYDGLDPIAEVVEPSPQYANYYRGVGRILEMHEFKSRQSPQGTAYYFHHDGLGSVSALTKHQGQSAHTYRYADFGMALDKNGRAADASNFTDPHNHYTFTGQEWDEFTWLHHFYAREYDPLVGMWLQQDPHRGRLGEPGTLHRYGYVGENPINLKDWYGFASESPKNWVEWSNNAKSFWNEVGQNLAVLPQFLNPSDPMARMARRNFEKEFLSGEFAENLVDAAERAVHAVDLAAGISFKAEVFKDAAQEAEKYGLSSQATLFKALGAAADVDAFLLNVNPITGAPLDASQYGARGIENVVGFFTGQRSGEDLLGYTTELGTDILLGKLLEVKAKDILKDVYRFNPDQTTQIAKKYGGGACAFRGLCGRPPKWWKPALNTVWANNKAAIDLLSNLLEKLINGDKIKKQTAKSAGSLFGPITDSIHDWIYSFSGPDNRKQ